MPLERMDDFFTERLEGYDAHMLANVPGCAEGYRRMAAALPAGAETLLDLGCGTGLELAEIFKTHPGIAVTGVDLTGAMLGRLREKYPGKAITLLCGDYFELDFGAAAFAAAVSFESLHHYPHAEKLALYRKLARALKPGGVYLECDYMVATQAEEDHWFAENARLRAAQGSDDAERLHYDTPCTVENQLRLLGQAGFTHVEQLWRFENTTLLAAHI